MPSATRCSKTSSKEPPTAQCDASLRSFVTSNGGLIDGIEIAQDALNPGCRFLRATRDIPYGTTIVRIPASLILSSSSARASIAVSPVLTAARELNLHEKLPDAEGDAAALTLLLLTELSRGKHSKWYVYFNSLPEKFRTPLTEDEESTALLLEGTPVLPLAMTLRDELREMYDDWLLPLAVNSEEEVREHYPKMYCTFDKFLYVHSVCDSRTFKIDNVSMLVPYADMANHAETSSDAVSAKVRGWRVHGDDESALGFEMYICKENGVKRGDEICISYGALSNWQLLLHYGFALPSNTLDCLPLSLQLPENEEEDQQVHVKKAIFLSLDSTGLLGLEHEITDNKPLPEGLLASTRLCVMDEKEIAPFTIHNADFSKAVSRRNEMEVKKQLRGIFQGMVNALADRDANEEAQDDYERYCITYVNSVQNIIEKALSALDKLGES